LWLADTACVAAGACLISGPAGASVDGAGEVCCGVGDVLLNEVAACGADETRLLHHCAAKCWGCQYVATIRLGGAIYASTAAGADENKHDRINMSADSGILYTSG